MSKGEADGAKTDRCFAGRRRACRENRGRLRREGAPTSAPTPMAVATAFSVTPAQATSASSLVFLLAISVTGVFNFVSTTQVAAQGQSTALERGYRTGYSDGYTAGFKDVTERAARDYQNKEDDKRADRSYNEQWGPIVYYRDGYQQGFETGYTAGYEQQQFNSTLPAILKRRGQPAADVKAPVGDTTTPIDNADVPVATQTGGAISIPRNTVLAIELLSPVSTDVSQRGDPFQARVVEPAQYAGFIVDGRVAEVSAGQSEGRRPTATGFRSDSFARQS